MENIIKIYSQKSKLEIIEEHDDGLKVGNGKRIVADIIFKESKSSPVIIVPGMNTSENGKRKILRKLRFLKDRILIFYNIPKLTLNEKDNDFFNFMKRSVSEIRGIIDFSQKNYKFEKVNIIGISLGGIISTIVSAVDDRIEKIILFASGGDFENITWRGLLRFVLKKDCSRKACHNLHKTYKKLLKYNLYDEIMELPRKCFLYDPILFANSIKKKVLMINGFFDTVIPFFSAMELKKRIENAEIIWYPATHLSLSIFSPFFKKKILEFLKN
ncbi:MAG: hypothetical protein DRP67_00695 [Candidatus Omnitrophota bacterium]|nr:MAG: hypothetical protein DRP67_00695 [Candidatus Omnitrophota bacterium]